MNMGRKLPPRLSLGFFISCHRVMCSLQKWGLIINFWWRLKSNGISLYLVLEVPQGLQQCLRKYSIPTWDFCLITMVFLRKPLSSNIEHFLLNYLVSSGLLIVLQGSVLPCGYFLDPSLCLTISPPIFLSPTSTPDWTFHPSIFLFLHFHMSFYSSPPTLKTLFLWAFSCFMTSLSSLR